MHQLRHSLLLTTALAALAFTPAHANPDGPNVVGGAATVNGVGTSTVIVNQTTDRAIIDWRTFNIGNGELTRFNQPNSGSVILNRVTGGLGPSQILGTISANGKVFLVNRDGILFGPNSVVNTAGFLATTSDIKNDDFMNGNGRFVFGIPGRPDASIVNLGTITAGDAGFAALVAPGVRNSGTITANVGDVTLASGNGFTLDFYGDKLITLQVGDQIAASVKDVATGETLDALVKNTGKLSANGGRVELSAVTARQVVDSVINNTGVIEANTVGQKGGQIILGAQTASTKVAGAPAQNVKVSGTLSAAGKDKDTKGGKVKITGENIALTGANIDASGKAGGGKGNTLVASLSQAALESEQTSNATNVTVDAASWIDASAKTAGDGGKVVLWSNGATTFHGTILANGAGISGKGGFVETSGHTLDINGSKILIGVGGAWLLDPGYIEINIYNVGLLEQQLNDGANVLLVTDSSGNGDIFINANVTWTTGATLTLAAYRDIIFASGTSITNTGSGNLYLGAGVSLFGTTSWYGNGTGTIKFGTEAGIDFTGSSGLVRFGYNPTVPVEGSGHKYTDEADFSDNVWTSGATDQFIAYMWVNNLTDLRNVNQNLAGTYAVANRIDASATAANPFTPIGDAETPFTGRFAGIGGVDAQGKLTGGTIDGLTVSGNWLDTGLFGVIGESGKVENLHLTNTVVSAGASTRNAGMLAGSNYGGIWNISVQGTVTSTTTASTGVTGGFGGMVGSNQGEMTNVGAIATVVAWGPSTSGYIDAGALVGRNSGTIRRGFSAGEVRATFSSPSTTYLGGLVGWNSGGNIYDSYSTAAVMGTGTYGYAGALVGVTGGGEIDGTYATGFVSLTGSNNTTGGLIGDGSSDVTNSYWNTETTGQSTSTAGGTGMTTAQLTSGIPDGFNSNTWTNLQGLSYPYLVGQPLNYIPTPTSVTPGTPTDNTPKPSVPNNNLPPPILNQIDLSPPPLRKSVV